MAATKYELLENECFRLRQLLEYAFGEGNWFQLPKIFLYFLKADEAIVLGYLLNLSSKLRATERYNGWFYCKVNKMSLEICCERHAQTRILNSLTKKEIIKTKRKGIPPKRYFKINFDTLNQLVAESLDEMNNKYAELALLGKPLDDPKNP